MKRLDFHKLTRVGLEHKNAIKSEPMRLFGTPPPSMWGKVVVRPLLCSSCHLLLPRFLKLRLCLSC